MLPAVADVAKAHDSNAAVHKDVPNNLVFDWELGDAAATDTAFENAYHVTRVEIVNNRLVPNAMEPRAAIGHYEFGTDSFTLYTTSQNPHVARLVISAFVGIAPEHKLTVVAPDVGGGFGSKIFIYAEECVALWASKKLRRPVKWTSDRTEAFLSDAHGRDHASVAEMAMDKEGNFLGLRVRTKANMGAYLSTFASCVPTYLYATLLAGQYKTPAIHAEVKAYYTNTAPVDAYRGAGRPEATYLIETLVEECGKEMGLDPAEIRRRNFIPRDAFPYQTPVALQYDTGNFQTGMDNALELADYAGFQARRRQSEANGKLRGVGFSAYIEACGIAPSAVVGSLGAGVGLWESAKVRFSHTGKVQVLTGTHSHGQGHETTFAQVVAEKLGVAFEDVDVIHGDTSKTPVGMGTYGSRSLAVGGEALAKACDKVVAKGKKIAAHLLEASEADIVFKDGSFLVVGTDKAKSIAEIAFAALVPHNYPAGLEPGLEETSYYDPANFTYPVGRLHLRTRGRSGQRRDRDPVVHCRRRLRQCRESDDRRGPGSWRDRAGYWPGLAGKCRVRRERSAALRLLHGLYHAARRRLANVHGAHRQGHALYAQLLGGERLRRGWCHRFAAGGHERHRRCDRHACINAGHAGKGVACDATIKAGPGGRVTMRET